MSVTSLATDREEDPARSLCLCHPPGPGLQFDPSYYSERVPDGENNKVEWEVEVAPAGDVITRKVCRNGAPGTSAAAAHGNRLVAMLSPRI